MKKGIFELRKIELDGEKQRYPLRKVYDRVISVYSSLEKAEEAMREFVAKEKAEKAECEQEEEDGCNYDSTFGYVIYEIRVDKVFAPWLAFSIRTYTKDGELNDECCWIDRENAGELLPFCGRPEEKIRFRVGDIVEVWHGHTVELEIVAGLPISCKEYEESWKERNVKLDVSDDCYLTYSLGVGDTHGHPQSNELFVPTKKVSAKLKHQLRVKLMAMGVAFGLKGQAEEELIRTYARDSKTVDEILQELEAKPNQECALATHIPVVYYSVPDRVKTLLPLSEEQAGWYDRIYLESRQMAKSERKERWNIYDE